MAEADPRTGGRRRRIVHISTVHPALDSRIFYREALLLHELGYEVAVYGSCAHEELIDGVQVRPVGSPGGRLRRILTSWLKGLRIVLRERADIYHFHDPELIPAVIVAGMLLRKHVVYDAHEDVSLMMSKDWLPRGVRGIVAASVAAVDWLCAKVADAVVTPTRQLKEKYERLGAKTALLVNFPSPVFLSDRDAGWVPFDRRERCAIHLGTLSMQRLQTLVGVATGFLEKHPEWSFELLGLHDPFLEWAREHTPEHLRGRLISLGKIPYRDVAARLCRAMIGVNYHTLDYQQIMVAIPVKVFEYLACGLSVVTTRVPLLAECAGTCPAVTWADESPEAYLKSLCDLASAADLAERGAAARDYSDHRFHCRVEAERLATLYESIWPGEPRPQVSRD